MGKKFWSIAAVSVSVSAVLLAFGAGSALAEGGTNFQLLITDKDPNGTNVCNSPGGEIIRTIPYVAFDPEIGSTRIVTAAATPSKDGWIKIIELNYEPFEGWMHTSVLGTCAEPTEDGVPNLYQGPNEDKPLGQIEPFQTVRPLDMSGAWLKVGFTDKKGKKVEGWIFETVASAGGPLAFGCAEEWAKIK